MKSLSIFVSWLNLLVNICGEQNQIIDLKVDPDYNIAFINEYNYKKICSSGYKSDSNNT